MKMVYVSVKQWKILLDLTRLVKNYSEVEEKNYAPCVDLYEMYLANGWQAKENYLDLKPVDASTFGRVIEKGSSCLRFLFICPTEVLHLGPFLLSTTVTPND